MVRGEEQPRLQRAGAGALLAAWGPVVLWMGVIFWLSGDRFSDEHTAAWLTRLPLLRALGLSPAMVETANLIVRKCAHFVEYAVLSMLAYRAFRVSSAAAPHRALTGAILLALSCSVVDELHQATTLTRFGSLKDVVLDGVGTLAGALAGAAVLYRRTR